MVARDGEGWGYLTNKALWFVLEGQQDPLMRLERDEIVDIRVKFKLLPFIQFVTVYTWTGVRHRFSFDRTFAKAFRRETRTWV